jgi:hypothetical protein
LKAFLSRHYPERLIYCTCGEKPMQSVEQFTTLTEEDRYRYSLITGHLARHLIDFVDPSCLRVTLLRDPIERITSHYFYARRTPAHYLYARIHAHKMTIQDYVSSGLSKELQNWYTTYFSGFTCPRAESNPDQSVSAAMDILTSRYDVVGTLENFSSFIQQLRDQANLSHPYRGKINNATPCRPATASLPEATIQAIRQANELDLLLYRRVRDLTTRRGDHLDANGFQASGHSQTCQWPVDFKTPGLTKRRD